MMDEKLIAQITAEVLRQLTQNGSAAPSAAAPSVCVPDGRLVCQDGMLPDLTTAESKAEITLSHMVNRDMMEQMKRKTPARIGIGSAGPRLRTRTYLTLRADHAGARDAVFRDFRMAHIPAALWRYRSVPPSLCRSFRSRRFSFFIFLFSVC